MALRLHSFVIYGCDLAVIAIKIILVLVGDCLCVLGCAWDGVYLWLLGVHALPAPVWGPLFGQNEKGR